jgi:cation-transporting P-type ATPase D
VCSAKTDSAAESHPFYEEITMVMKECRKVGLPVSIKSSPPPMEGEPIWINTKDQLEDLVKLLSHECEFAVDTEQHSVRSFWGFTALLQVSKALTRVWFLLGQ